MPTVVRQQKIRKDGKIRACPIAAGDDLSVVLFCVGVLWLPPDAVNIREREKAGDDEKSEKEQHRKGRLWK